MMKLAEILLLLTFLGLIFLIILAGWKAFERTLHNGDDPHGGDG